MQGATRLQWATGQVRAYVYRYNIYIYIDAYIDTYRDTYICISIDMYIDRYWL